MKKMIASVIAAALMSVGLLTGAQVAASADYGPSAPPAAAKHVIKDVKHAIHHKGKLGPKRAHNLVKRVRLAKRLGLIRPRIAKYLIKRIHKDTRR